VVVPLYNHAGYLSDAIASILAQGIVTVSGVGGGMGG
jgi:glycosyltransferase involved in cell wall biosynthesis